MPSFHQLILHLFDGCWFNQGWEITNAVNFQWFDYDKTIFFRCASKRKTSVKNTLIEDKNGVTDYATIFIYKWVGPFFSVEFFCVIFCCCQMKISTRETNFFLFKGKRDLFKWMVTQLWSFGIFYQSMECWYG